MNNLVGIFKNYEISIEAKAIYCFLVSNSENGTTCLSVAEQLEHLNISQQRYYKHRKALIEEGYIEVLQQNLGSNKSYNIYKILR